MGLGIEERLRAIQADPATTFEDYTLVRSALHAPARPGGDGPVPGHGLRPRLAAGRRRDHRSACSPSICRPSRPRPRPDRGTD